MYVKDKVIVTGTGYYGAARQQIRQMSLQLGVRYSGDLVNGVTTHLVCKDKLATETEKVSVARAWGLPIVQHAWLLDSIANDRMLPVDDYGLDSGDSVNSLQSSLRHRVYHSLNTSLPLKTTPHPQTKDVDQIEVLRSSKAPICNLPTDLLFDTAVSPNKGMQLDTNSICYSCMQIMTHCDLCAAWTQTLAAITSCPKLILQTTALKWHRLPHFHPLCPHLTSALTVRAPGLSLAHQLLLLCTGRCQQ